MLEENNLVILDDVSFDGTDTQNIVPILIDLNFA